MSELLHRSWDATVRCVAPAHEDCGRAAGEVHGRWLGGALAVPIEEGADAFASG